MKAKATVRMNFQGESQLSMVFSALAPEAQRPSPGRSKVTLEKDGTSLVLRIEANDTIALRAALNAYLRWISSLRNVLTFLENGSQSSPPRENA